LAPSHPLKKAAKKGILVASPNFTARRIAAMIFSSRSLGSSGRGPELDAAPSSMRRPIASGALLGSVTTFVATSPQFALSTGARQTGQHWQACKEEARQSVWKVWPHAPSVVVDAILSGVMHNGQAGPSMGMLGICMKPRSACMPWRTTGLPCASQTSPYTRGTAISRPSRDLATPIAALAVQ